MNAKLLSAVAVATSVAVATPAAASVTFAGGATGCFQQGGVGPCTPVDGGLTYTAGTFSQNTNASGFAAIGGGAGHNFGTISLNLNPRDYGGNHDTFNLLVTFALPADAGSGSFTANLLGSLVALSDGGVSIVWQNPVQSFSSTLYGPFTLTLDNVSFSGSLQAGQLFPLSQDITGRIQAAVPEPGTWALMLLGFGGMGLAMRRRRKPALAQLA
jgi:hypothetical protein